MPKNRQEIPREERILGILDVAAELFAERDASEVAMAEVARRAGVRSGAVYWYFDSKDHLLAAVLRRLTETGAERIAALAQDTTPQQRLIQYLAEMRPMRTVHASAHARLSSSPVVAEAHELLMRQLHSLIQAALEERPTEERHLLAGLMTSSFEGANQPGYDGPSATELITFVLERMVPASAAVPGDRLPNAEAGVAGSS
ncbi:TetR/AcrR family transcriptional regulator [Streptomyces justiciae]|uniref:TetR/AcrR family transcriptional regulator n=1 Tax=Streptomyces justiciae TaxID=2780140 RepID=UPI00211868D6|nr:TetR/AcrR family transcriptional regulator [Streptomyces justiciae]MCW8378651.1 TetR/AcrR family transcriptional regulator [Streptomyces justiciae]